LISAYRGRYTNSVKGEGGSSERFQEGWNVGREGFRTRGGGGKSPLFRRIFGVKTHTKLKKLIVILSALIRFGTWPAAEVGGIKGRTRTGQSTVQRRRAARAGGMMTEGQKKVKELAEKQV